MIGGFASEALLTGYAFLRHRHGMGAWQSGTVPFAITSAPMIATAYMDVFSTLVSSMATSGAAPAAASSSAGGTAMYVVDVGAGHCKLGYHLAVCAQRLHSRRLCPKVCVVSTDISEAAVRSAMKLPCFQ